MYSQASVDWNTAAYAEYRHEELLRAAEHERLVRQCRQMSWFGRLIAKLSGIKKNEKLGQVKTADQVC
jgi:hypothetical protein